MQHVAYNCAVQSTLRLIASIERNGPLKCTRASSHPQFSVKNVFLKWSIEASRSNFGSPDPRRSFSAKTWVPGGRRGRPFERPRDARGCTCSRNGALRFRGGGANRHRHRRRRARRNVRSRYARCAADKAAVKKCLQLAPSFSVFPPPLASSRAAGVFARNQNVNQRRINFETRMRIREKAGCQWHCTASSSRMPACQ